MSHLILLVTLLAAAEHPNLAPPDVNRLIRQLGSERYPERETASKALQELGEKALPHLRKAASSKDLEVRRRIARLLKRGDARVNQLIRQLGSEMYVEREAASKALEALGPRALKALQDAKRNPDVEVKRRAVQIERRIRSGMPSP